MAIAEKTILTGVLDDETWGKIWDEIWDRLTRNAVVAGTDDLPEETFQLAERRTMMARGA